MLHYIICALSVLGTAALYLAFPALSPWWIVPLLLGFFLVLNILYMLYIAVTSLFMSTKKPIEKPSRYSRFIIWLTVDWLVKMSRVRVRVKGRELIPDCPCVILSNHRSAFDPLSLLTAMKERHLVYICKESVTNTFGIGPYLYQGGFIGIDRTNGIRAFRALVKAADEMNRLGVDVGIFPEGTRSKDCKLLSFKPGAFVLAKKANAPIVVMTTKGTERIVKQMLWRRTTVEMEVVKVIDAATVEESTIDELSDLSRSLIEEHLSK